MKNNKLIIITHNQFGYQISSYKYVEYLKDKFDITYICFDYGRPYFADKDIEIVYVSKSGLLIQQLIRFLKKVFKIMRKGYNIAIIKYFPFCSLINLFFSRNKNVLDIRTGSVNKIKWKREISNFGLKIDAFFYKHILILSESLRKLLNIKESKTLILPLGSDPISNDTKLFDKMHLLYVGSLNNRNIWKTVLGYKRFYSEYNNLIDTKYTIIGPGNDAVVNKLQGLINDNNLSNVMDLVGLVPYSLLGNYFKEHNIGIAYVPQTDYYDVQPPTKTFEFASSGMPVLGTDTYENRLVVNDENGVLVNDDIDDFFYGLVLIYNNLSKYNSDIIRNSVVKYYWENIITNILTPYLCKIFKLVM